MAFPVETASDEQENHRARDSERDRAHHAEKPKLDATDSRAEMFHGNALHLDVLSISTQNINIGAPVKARFDLALQRIDLKRNWLKLHYLYVQRLT